MALDQPWHLAETFLAPKRGATLSPPRFVHNMMDDLIAVKTTGGNHDVLHPPETNIFAPEDGWNTPLLLLSFWFSAHFQVLPVSSREGNNKRGAFLFSSSVLRSKMELQISTNHHPTTSNP